MKAMILAAGRGERMRPLTDFTPKPLLKVGGKPLIVWHLERLAQAGFKEIVINYAHLGEQIEQTLGDGAQWGLSIQYSPEKVALETAGGIANALHLLTENGTKTEPFLVVNGDTFTEIDFKSTEMGFKSTALQPNIHAGYGHALKLAHLVLVDNPPQHPNGDFAIENGMLKNDGTKMLTFSGVGVYHPELFAEVTKGQPAKLAPLLRKAIDNNAVTAEYYQGVWYDIGTPERLKNLDESLKLLKKNYSLSPIVSLESYIQLVEMAYESKVVDFYSALRGLGYTVNGKRFDEGSTTIRQFLEYEYANKREEDLMFSYLFSKLIETDRGYGVCLSRDLVIEVIATKGGFPSNYEIFYKRNSKNENWVVLNQNSLDIIANHSDNYNTFVLMSQN